MKNIIVIKEMSAGNEMVGDMWKETKSFKENDPISKVIDWAFGEGNSFTRRRNVILTIEANETN